MDRGRRLRTLHGVLHVPVGFPFPRISFKRRRPAGRPTYPRARICCTRTALARPIPSVDAVLALDYLSHTRVGGKGRPTMTHQLAGKRILIVEDEQLFAEYLTDAMTAAGAEIIEPVGTVNAALDIIANMRLDGATLDLKLAGETTFRNASRANYLVISMLQVKTQVCRRSVSQPSFRGSSGAGSRRRSSPANRRGGVDR